MAKRTKRRRRKGTGTFTTDPRTGKPVWRRGYTDANGNRKEIWLSADTDDELMEKVTNAQAALQTRTDPNITIDGYIPIYLSHRRNWKGRTYCSYKSVLVNKVKPYFKGIRIRDLTPRTIEDFINGLVTANGSTSTALTCRRILSAMLGEAVRDRIVLINPVLATKPPKNTCYTAPPEREPMQLEDLRKLLVFAADPKRVFAVTHPNSQFDSDHLPGIVRKNTRNCRKKPPYNIGYSYLYKCYWIIILLAAKTGLRPGELRALRWKNFFEKKGYIQITSAEGWDYNGRPEIQDPKSLKGKRVIRLDAETIQCLNKWKMDQKAYGKTVGHVYGNTQGFIFTDWSGKTIQWTNFIRRYFRPLLQHLNISDNIVFYSLRHMNLSVLLEATGNPEMVAQRAGHTDTALIFNRYGHALNNAQDAAVEATAKFLKIPDINPNTNKGDENND